MATVLQTYSLSLFSFCLFGIVVSFTLLISQEEGRKMVEDSRAARKREIFKLADKFTRYELFSLYLLIYLRAVALLATRRIFW